MRYTLLLGVLCNVVHDIMVITVHMLMSWSFSRIVLLIIVLISTHVVLPVISSWYGHIFTKTKDSLVLPVIFNDE